MAASPSWLRKRREPSLPGFALHAYDGGRGGNGQSSLLDEATGLLRATKERTEMEGQAAVASAVVSAALRGQQPAPAPVAPNLDQTGKIVEVTSSIVDLQGKQLDRSEQRAERIKAEADAQAQSAAADVEDRYGFVIAVLDKGHEREIETMNRMAEMREQDRRETQEVVGGLTAKIDTLIQTQLQSQLDTIKAENERLKAQLAAGAGTGAVAGAPPGAVAGPGNTPGIVGMSWRQLPNGHWMAVMDQTPAAGNGKGELATIREALGQAKELISQVDEIRGPRQQTQAFDYSDPTVRWRHHLVDQDQEDRAAERERKNMVAGAVASREEALGKAIIQAPDVLRRVGPKIGAALFGGAPERGAHNGMPDRPPTRPAGPAGPAARPGARTAPPPPQRVAGGDEGGVEI